MYDWIRKAFDPQIGLLGNLLAGILSSRDYQLSSLLEHLSLFYSKENIVTDAAFGNMESLPNMDNLDSERSVNYPVNL